MRRNSYGLLTNEEKAQLLKHQLKGQLGVIDDTILTTDFLKLYIHYGSYINKLRNLLPTTHSHEGQLQRIQALHKQFQNHFEQKLQMLIKEEQVDFSSFEVQATV